MGDAPRITKLYVQAAHWVYIEWDPLEEDAWIEVTRQPPFPQPYPPEWMSPTSFSDQYAQPSTKYTYTVCATYAGENEPACSTTLPVTTPPATTSELVPPWITQVTPFSDAVEIHWAANQDYGFYQVRWAVEGGAEQQVEIDSHGTSGWWRQGGLHPDTNYSFIVQGCYSGIFGSHCSDWSARAHVRTLPPPLPTLRAPIHSGFMIQSHWGHQGNFETLLALAGGWPTSGATTMRRTCPGTGLLGSSGR